MVYSRSRYTPNEERILAILQRSRGRHLDSVEIVRRHYARRKPPQFARQSVVVVLNSLIEKTRRNGEKFKICKSPRSGPHPISYWTEAA